MNRYDAVKEWRKANPDKVAAQARRYRASHPEKVRAVKNRYRGKPETKELERMAVARRRSADPEGALRRRLAHEARVEAKRVAVAGRPRAMICEICAVSQRTVFDHDHATGVFRGWICDRCNKVLGIVKDSPDLLRKLALYLEVPNGQTEREAA